MGLDYEPYPDFEKPRRYRAPKALARLRAKFSYDRQVKEFRRVFRRDPASDGELDVFVENHDALTDSYSSRFRSGTGVPIGRRVFGRRGVPVRLSQRDSLDDRRLAGRLHLAGRCRTARTFLPDRMSGRSHWQTADARTGPSGLDRRDAGDCSARCLATAQEEADRLTAACLAQHDRGVARLVRNDR